MNRPRLKLGDVVHVTRLRRKAVDAWGVIIPSALGTFDEDQPDILWLAIDSCIPGWGALAVGKAWWVNTYGDEDFWTVPDELPQHLWPLLARYKMTGAL